MHIEQMRDVINGALPRFAQERWAEKDTVTDAAHYMLRPDPGGRWRSLLCLAAASIHGDWRKAIPLACAVESIHAASLILDDLPCMDGMRVRRGVPTCWVKFGESTALLAALRLTTDGRLFPEYLVPQTLAAEGLAFIRRRFSEVEIVMNCGQHMDLTLEEERIQALPIGTRIQLLNQMHIAKTGEILRFAIELGLAANHPKGCTVNWIKEFGYNLGLAYQHGDDLKDALGAPTMGKPAGMDKGKVNAIAIYGTRKTAELLRQYRGSTLDAIAHLPDAPRKILTDITDAMLKKALDITPAA